MFLNSPLIVLHLKLRFFLSGIYDEKWIDSTIAILRKCKEHGLTVFMDPHQDVVRRFFSGAF